MLGKRLLHSMFLFFGIVVLNFGLFHLSPGDPTNQYFSPKVKRSDIEALKKQMGVDQPLDAQFSNWCAHVLKGDLGYSWAKHRPVSDILKEAIPATLQLTVLALIINLIIGCLVGIFCGVFSHRWFGKLLDMAIITLYSIPVFLLALFFIYFFSLKLKLFPASGMNTFFVDDFWSIVGDRIKHILLPAIVLGLSGAAATSRYVQGQMICVLKQDYIRTGLANGLSRRRILFRHAFSNVLIPVITLLGLYFPFLLSSAFFVEVIFGWPGMGRVTYEAIFSKDLPVIMIVNLIAGIMVILGNLISDSLYRFVDPRIRFR